MDKDHEAKLQRLEQVMERLHGPAGYRELLEVLEEIGPDVRFPIHETLEAVSDRASFLTFVKVLAAERLHEESLVQRYPGKYVWQGAHEWENHSINMYLEAALNCKQDPYSSPAIIAEHAPPGLVEPGHRIGQTASWSDFADFLWAGKIYE